MAAPDLLQHIISSHKTHLGHPDCARQASPTLPQRRMHSPPANAKARGPQQARHHAGVLPVLLVASRNHGLAEHRIRTKGGAARGGLLVAVASGCCWKALLWRGCLTECQRRPADWGKAATRYVMMHFADHRVFGVRKDLRGFILMHRQ
ncbi:hypothetical protein PMIN02_008091 [Paraphaeosphaeria minitans]